ncbi:MAG: His/Gly/Thr/Pro-type tRNA ligase C-terminal domain-containing protein [Bacteroidia bacterium]|nr:His/Gly/Thr/Pro-type tRNA ligase C-terminal domain-containing protein [Bacteroidia bacterium]
MKIQVKHQQTIMDISLMHGGDLGKKFEIAEKNGYPLDSILDTHTVLIGALIMAHSDDDGLVLPPQLAPYQGVTIPIHKSEQEYEKVTQKCELVAQHLKKAGIRYKIDARKEFTPGWKYAEYELKGIPLRIAIGPRDLENNTLEIARRNTKTKQSISADTITETTQKLLKEIQDNIYQTALSFRNRMTTRVDNFKDFETVLNEKGGFIEAHWDGTAETELKIKELTKATILCIPLENPKEEGKCVYSGKKSTQRVLFAINY